MVVHLKADDVMKLKVEKALGKGEALQKSSLMRSILISFLTPAQVSRLSHGVKRHLSY